MVAIVIMP